jgi:polyisoprenoid-binding protein YceI
MTISVKRPEKTLPAAFLTALLATAGAPALAADWNVDPTKSTLGFSGT